MEENEIPQASSLSIPNKIHSEVLIVQEPTSNPNGGPNETSIVPISKDLKTISPVDF